MPASSPRAHCATRLRRRTSQTQAIILGLFGVNSFGCVSSLPQPTAAQAASAQERFPGTTVEALADARTTYAQICAGCHTLYLPDHLSAERWPATIHRMQTRHRVALTKAQHQQVLMYVLSVRSPRQSI